MSPGTSNKYILFPILLISIIFRSLLISSFGDPTLKMSNVLYLNRKIKNQYLQWQERMVIEDIEYIYIF